MSDTITDPPVEPTADETPDEHEHDGDPEHDDGHLGDEPTETGDGDPEHIGDEPPEGTETSVVDPPDGPTAAGPSQQDIERAMKALEKESERHKQRIEEIMGEDFADLERCPLCPSPFDGFRFPVPPPPEVVARVKEAIGEPADPSLKADQYSKVCDMCEGLGSVATGSHVQGQAKVTCLGCKGRGWVAVGPERESGQITTPAAVAPIVDYTQPPPPPVDPPEVAALKALGYVVVPPVQPLPPAV